MTIQLVPLYLPVLEDEQHIVFYTGNGVQTFFEFVFSMDADSEVLVVVSGTLVTNYQTQIYGIRFFTPPPMGASIIITRITDVTQLRDWNPFDAFEASKTELAADKLILLKQEAKNWRADLNLYTVQAIDGATIVNSAGADAFIPLWNVSLPKAGLFNGELTEQAPGDGAEVIEPPGYVWFQAATPEPPAPGVGQFSSALYPVDAHEDMASNSVVVSARHWTHEWAKLDITPRVVGGSLVVTIAYDAFTAPPESLDSNSAVLSGSIVVVIKYGAITTPDEAIESSSSVLGGLLKIVLNYIAFTAEPSSMESSSAVLSGSLTTYVPP